MKITSNKKINAIVLGKIGDPRLIASTDMNMSFSDYKEQTFYKFRGDDAPYIKELFSKLEATELEWTNTFDAKDSWGQRVRVSHYIKDLAGYHFQVVAFD
jgi:leucyl aminopeptidase (aminopeptidase T)